MRKTHPVCAAGLIGVLCSLAPAAFSSVQGAQAKATYTLFISNHVDTDSAAVRAANKWLHSLSRTGKYHIRHLKNFTGEAASFHNPVLVPLREWSRDLPAFNILRLPFFYEDIQQVHRAIDGETGKLLEHISAKSAWKLLAVWDAGMSNFSGNQDYSALLNLKGMEFVAWEPDPLLAKELRALDVWLRVIDKNGVQRNARQCLVDSRSTTPIQMWNEHLPRVHLDLTLTSDRYQGYVLAMPVQIWKGLTESQRQRIHAGLQRVKDWERKQAALQQQQALKKLQKAGMQLHMLSHAQRIRFAGRMPPWKDFFGSLDAATVHRLIAAAGIVATATATDPTTRTKPAAQPLPASHHSQN